MKISMRGNAMLINAFEYAKELDSKINVNRPITLTNAFENFLINDSITISEIQKFNRIKDYKKANIENLSIEVDTELFTNVKEKMQREFPGTHLQYPFICRLALTSYIMYMLAEKPQTDIFSVPTSNRNQNLRWASDNNFLIDKRIIDNPDLRGIYGIFVESECVYVGRASSVYARFFMGDCHIQKIRIGNHVSRLIDGVNHSKTIEFRLLEEVPYLNIHPAKEAQRLASRECYWIDYFQAQDQCLEQYPEGKWNH